jgi:hypothetical protein
VKKRDVERKRKKIFCRELRRGGMRRREGEKKIVVKLFEWLEKKILGVLML